MKKGNVVIKNGGTAIIILALLFLAVSGLTWSTASGEESASLDFTHTVFGESGTATW